MSERTRADAIYLEQWLTFHPYDKPAPSDYYYLKLSNEIYSVLKDNDDVAWFEFSPEVTKKLACFLTCYFEDVISGPGLWRAFIGRVKELYGTWLPFYEPEDGPYFTDEYFPDEINYADINFLLWYYFSMARKDENLISPNYVVDALLPGKVFDILEREFEKAPENETLKQFYVLRHEAVDFYELNTRIRWVVLYSWLLFFNGEELEKLIDERIEEEEDSLSEDMLEGFVYDFTDTYALSVYTPLLAMQGKEWIARLQGEDHPLYGEIMELSGKKDGLYLYMGKEKKFVLFRHLDSGKELSVSASSMDLPLGAVQGRTVIYGGFTRWHGTWWFSGTMIAYGDEPGLAGKLKNADQTPLLFSEDPEWKHMDMEGQHRAFMEYNGGKAMAFVEGWEDAVRFIGGFYLFYNESLDQSRRLKRKRKRMILASVLNADLVPDGFGESGDPLPGMIFFNPEHGLEVASGYNLFIPDQDNPWYAGGTEGSATADTEAVEGDGAMSLVYYSKISGAWAHHLVKKYDLPGIAFPGEGGRELLLENFDFMLRFWKGSNYYPGSD